MSTKTVYVLHKNGANSHYIGLDFLLKENNIKIKYREFSVIGMFFKSLVKLKGKTLYKQIVNGLFLLSLLVTKNKKVVLSIAPYDKKLGKLLPLFKNHKIYYHTSWTCWDQTFHPKRKNNSPKVYAIWKKFLEHHTTHIFSVTQKGKKELLKNYALEESHISVVNHSVDQKFAQEITPDRKRNSFIYLGRLIPIKGIEELLAVFSKVPSCSLTIMGKGEQQDIVENYANTYPNIIYKNYTSSTQELAYILSKHEYMILNSKRTNQWEELFGLIIIESMSQGLIPIAPSHAGPSEIITSDIGYLFEEGKLDEMLEQISHIPTFNEEMSQNARKTSTIYQPKHIAKKWQKILA